MSPGHYRDVDTTRAMPLSLPAILTRPAIRRGLLALAMTGLACCVSFGCLAWSASSRLICPARRSLQDYHREIHDHANEHGLVVRNFAVRTSDGYDTPCLLCEPSTHPGLATKGNKVRQELQALGKAVPPWGTIRATLVLLHGHHGRKEDHLPVAERLCAIGFRCILIDLPAHGDHPAPFITFGINEAKVPHEVLESAAERYAFRSQPAGLFGISQGGAIALQAAARADDQWFAVAELSSFASLDDVIAAQARRFFGPLRLPAHATVRFLVQSRSGFDPRWVRPVDSAMLLKSPAVLIGHGSVDGFVSPRQAGLLFSVLSCRKKQFLSVPGAGHNNVLITPAPVYSTLGAFYLDSLPTDSALLHHSSAH